MQIAKERFRENAMDVSFMAQLSEAKSFLRAMDCAMSVMFEAMPAAAEIEVSNQYYQQLCGARLFQRILLSLHESPKELPALKNDNLKPVPERKPGPAKESNA